MSVIPLEYVAFPCAGVISAAVVFYLWCCFLTAISNFDIQDPEHLRHPLRDRTITLPRNTSLSDLSLNDLRPPSPLSSDEDEGVLQRNNSETSLAATVKTAISSTSVHHVLELGNFPEEAAKLSVEDRYKFVRSMTKSSKPGGFEPNSLVGQASIRWYEELAFALGMLMWLGGPLASFYSFTLVSIFGTWTQLGYFLVFYFALSFHPLPNFEKVFNKSRFSIWSYKYFSYRLMWSDDVMDKIQASAPWIGAAGPHSVMPFGSLLNIPAINTFIFRTTADGGVDSRRFKGATASVLRYIPMLRYIYAWGAMDCSGKNLAAKVKDGYCVGVVCDGIAGIFKGGRTQEAFFLKDRKALARWCLKHGVPVVPAYSIGNTQCFYSWFDSLGFLEWVSRKTQVALFLYFGRLGLPIPFRTNVTQLLGAPIVVDKKERPTEEEVDALHQQLLEAYVTLFETHKHALGWGEKELKIV